MTASYAASLLQTGRWYFTVCPETCFSCERICPKLLAGRGGVANGASSVSDNGDGSYDGVYTITQIDSYDAEQGAYGVFQLSISLVELTPGQDIGQPGQGVGKEGARRTRARLPLAVNHS